MKNYKKVDGQTYFHVTYDEAPGIFIAEILSPAYVHADEEKENVKIVSFWESTIKYELKSECDISQLFLKIITDAINAESAIEVVYDENYCIVETSLPDKKIYKLHYEEIEHSEIKEVIIELNPVIEGLSILDAIYEEIISKSCIKSLESIDECIPFHYKRDGCFARAHAMRYMIEHDYGYSSKKIFSYDSLTPRRSSNKYKLAVKDKKKCIYWWYHVAPVVAVKSEQSTDNYVLDPSIFDKPVMIEEWSKRQEEKSCSKLSRVGSTEIRESYIYTPNGARDDRYIKTNRALKRYNLKNGESK